MSASQIIWKAASRPAHAYPRIALHFVCAVCAHESDGGVVLSEIETPTMADHANVFRFGSAGVCDACAWLFAAGKGRPGNFIATSDRVEYAVISLESVVNDKRPWIEIIRDLAALPKDARVTGVLTTDVKPRLWPRCRVATIDRFGLYVHATDYDFSQWVDFGLADCLAAIDAILPALRRGWSKASVRSGLFADHARASSDPAQALVLEQSLSPLRGRPEFLPALIMAGVTKEQKQDVKRSATGRDARSATTRGYSDREDCPRLL